MTHDEREKRIERILVAAARLRKVKGHDYSCGDDVMENLRPDGWYGCVVRLTDKLMRLRAYFKKGHYEVDSEKFLDTTLDMLNFTLFAHILFEDGIVADNDSSEPTTG